MCYCGVTRHRERYSWGPNALSFGNHGHSNQMIWLFHCHHGHTCLKTSLNAISVLDDDQGMKMFSLLFSTPAWANLV